MGSLIGCKKRQRQGLCTASLPSQPSKIHSLVFQFHYRLSSFSEAAPPLERPLGVEPGRSVSILAGARLKYEAVRETAMLGSVLAVRACAWPYKRLDSASLVLAGLRRAGRGRRLRVPGPLRAAVGAPLFFSNFMMSRFHRTSTGESMGPAPVALPQLSDERLGPATCYACSALSDARAITA